jgi:anti-anti-sigma factor
MSFDVKITEIDDIWRVSLSGHLDTTTSSDLEKSLQEILAKPASKILIDFSTLDYISSSGLRVFLIAAKQVKKSGGKLVLCKMQEFIKNVFAISGFLQILEVVDDCEAAMAQMVERPA